MNHRDKVKLLFGPYRAPALKRGDRAFCLARDCDVVITSWTDARISWPRCNLFGQMGGSGILVDEELARAIRHESAAAIYYWWGVSRNTVWWWRRSLGIGPFDTEGSRRLFKAGRKEQSRKTRGRKRSPEQVEEMRRRAKRLNLARFISPERNPHTWRPEEIALLGTAQDDVIAKKLGRSTRGVRVKRTRLGIASARDRRKREYRRLKNA